MWMMTQTWQDVLFLHWPISPQELQKYIPNELQLDLFEENAWLSAVLFKVHRHRLRFLPPIPGMNNYLQLNVRTYVEYNGRKGVYFFHLDVTNYILSKVTAIGSLPYRYSQLVGKQTDHHFSYTSHYKACDERLKVNFTLGDHTATNFDHWIVERYHSWSKYNNKLLRIDIHHSPWELQRARVTIQSNSLASFMKKTFQHMEPIAHYAKNKVARVFPPVMEHKSLRN